MAGQQRVIVTGLRGREQVYECNQNTTVKKLFEKVAERNNIEVQEIHLVHNGKELQWASDTKLKDLNIGEKDILWGYIRAHGGLAQQVRLVQGDCMVFGEGQVAVMSCGHMISPEALKSYFKTEVTDNRRFRMKCPDCSCTELWDYSIVRQVAGLTDEEDSAFRRKIRENYAKAYDIKECPRCETSCCRKNQDNPCAVCPFCTGKRGKLEFCWYCFNEWSSSSYGTNCGNLSCPMTGYLNQLANCPTKEIVGVPNCPTMRCCPRCKTVIQHLSACKHMNCRICHLDFCFICLRQKDDRNGWQCGSHNSSCSVAARQTRM